MRWRWPAAGLLILVGVFAVGLGLGRLSVATGPPDPAPAAAGPDAPIRVRIPTLEVDAAVHPVGLDERGAIAAPPLSRAHEAGWYAAGPAPGQHGAAVVVGHIDDADGPAVFHRLPELREGARIEVTRRDGGFAAFEVAKVASYPKDRLPSEVYGDFDDRELRLITCGGEWVGGSTGYADNVVVFARLVDGDGLSRS